MTVGTDSESDGKSSVPQQQSVQRIRCFFDVGLGSLPAGRIVFELYPDITPKTCENFRSLCTGDKGLGKTTEKPLHYKGVIFHRVVKDFMIQSGDFSANNGTGGESIYGGTFDDENFSVKHDKPFLLSMANRGKGTNGSQFFITTQPAPHLDNVHVVFGHVVSGHDLVRQLEQLPVDRNSRPLQDAIISNCGELVRQIKVKKDKKKKKVRAEVQSDSSDDERKKRKDKKKKKKKAKEAEKEESADEASNKSDEHEEGEIEDGEAHPLVTLTKIDPKDIPEVSNKFLMRGQRESANPDVAKDDKDNDGRRDRDGKRKDRTGGRDTRNNFGWSKKRIPLSRSGRVIKGRGVFRYRTPSRSRSRSKSQTPPHWRQAQKRTIKLSDLEKSEEEQRQREQEIKRREADRKKRHDEMARDSKKSFFELNQENNYKKTTKKENGAEEKEDGELDTTADVSIKEKPTGTVEVVAKTDRQTIKYNNDSTVDMNALDYEHHGSDREENDESTNKKSESMAMAFGVNIKTTDHRVTTERAREQAISDDDGKRKKELTTDKKDIKRDKNDRSRKDRSVERSRRRSRSRNASPVRQPYNSRSGGFRGAISPRRSNFSRGGRQLDQRRRRSRSVDRRSRRSPERRRSRDRKIRSRSRDRRRSYSRRRSRDRRRSRSRTRSPSRSKRGDRTSRSKSKSGKQPERKTKTPDPIPQIPQLPVAPIISPVEDKEKLHKEKMLKRAEALLLLKDHMRKEIEEQEKRQAEKQQKMRDELERAETALEIARLEKIKKETLQKLKVQEEIKQLAAVKKVLEVVVSSVKSSHASSKKSKRSSRSSSDDDRESRKRKRSDKRKRARRHSSSD